LDKALNCAFPGGVGPSGLQLISDNGSQPTSVSFMEDMATLSIKQIFSSYVNPKENADTERVARTIKEEVVWLIELETLEEAIDKIGG
jgi:putative transposase